MTSLAQIIERLTAECEEAGAREVAAWAERDQYLASNVKLKAEVDRLARHRRATVPASELIEWFKARPGISWNATITDIDKALDDICARAALTDYEGGAA